MTTRRTTVLAALVVAGLVLVVGGFLLALTTDGGPRVVGIIAVVVGLACLRAASWSRRVRRLTEAGLDLQRPPDDAPHP
ncbi:MAG: hypothetical protein ACR2K3_08030 [Nocardioides sp.]